MNILHRVAETGRTALVGRDALLNGHWDRHLYERGALDQEPPLRGAARGRADRRARAGRRATRPTSRARSARACPAAPCRSSAWKRRRRPPPLRARTRVQVLQQDAPHLADRARVRLAGVPRRDEQLALDARRRARSCTPRRRRRRPRDAPGPRRRSAMIEWAFTPGRAACWPGAAGRGSRPSCCRGWWGCAARARWAAPYRCAGGSRPGA